MNDSLDNAKTMQDAITRDTIGDMLTQQPDQAIVLADRYRIVRKLGEGGMGSVWLAEDTKLDARQVAIKMLPVVLAANKRAIRQLKTEAKVAIQLAHPNIATLRGFEESDEGPFLVMDYILGQTLEDLLADRGRLPEDEVIRLFTPIAQALDYAHGQNVIHRDIKPSNILIRDDGIPFIADFGIAREMKDTMTRVTGRSTSGTLPYMSPEQLRGDTPSPAQDVYSLAATIYETLSGSPPFHRGQIEYQIMNGEPESIALNAPRLANTVMQALAKDPLSRPSSCSGVLQNSWARVVESCQSHGETLTHRPASSGKQMETTDSAFANVPSRCLISPANFSFRRIFLALPLIPLLLLTALSTIRPEEFASLGYPYSHCFRQTDEKVYWILALLCLTVVTLLLRAPVWSEPSSHSTSEREGT